MLPTDRPVELLDVLARFIQAVNADPLPGAHITARQESEAIWEDEP